MTICPPDVSPLPEPWASLQYADVYLPHPNPTFGNPAFETAPLRVLIVRLSPFHDVDRSTPHLVLFHALRCAVPEAYIDMAFFPSGADRERLMQARVPLLHGVQSLRSMADFDLVLVSNAYTLELINLPYLLLHSGIPLLASERGEEWPPLILGGSNALAAQALVTESGDSLADAFFFGEGEGQVDGLVRSLQAYRGLPKRLRLERVAEALTGLWVTGAWPEHPVRQACWTCPDKGYLATEYPLLNGPEAHTARIQISFGCPALCAFCFEGYTRRPYREVALADLIEVARRLKQSQGCRVLELYSYNFNTYTDIFALLFELNRLFERVSAMSQRVDLLHTVPGLLETEVAADKRHFTLGIEGISARMRTWLHKSLPSEAIMGVLERLLREKIRQIKLFYLLTGYEQAEDFAEFRSFLRDLKALRCAINPGIRVTFSFGLLIRMPFTPLRYDQLFLERKFWRPLIGAAKSACETNGFEFRLAMSWEEYATSQVLAMGGYWLWRPVVELAAEGYCYDKTLVRGIEPAASAYWRALQGWLRENGHWSRDLLGEKGTECSFPFDFVDTGVSSSFMYREYLRVKNGQPDEGYCLGGPGGKGRCLGCGACEPAQRSVLVEHMIQPADASCSTASLSQLMRAKWRIKPLYVHLRLPVTVAGAGAEWLSAWVMRTLLNLWPDLTDNLIATQECLFTVGENEGRYPGLWGETVFALKGWDIGHLRDTLFRDVLAVAEVGLISIADGFMPGVFQRACLSFCLPLATFPNAIEQLVAFLRASYVPCNLRRDGERYYLEIASKGLKKRTVFSGEIARTDGVLHVRLEVGPKFNPRAYLRSFGEPDRSRQVRIEVSELVW